MKINKIYFSILLLAIFLSSATQAQNSSLSGRVFDSASNTYIAYVHVQLHEFRGQELVSVIAAISDEDGTYNFLDLDEGRYRLIIRCLGYSQQNFDVDLAENQRLVKDIGLDPGKLELGEVSVASLRYNKTERQVAAPIEVIPREKFPHHSSMSMSDVVATEPGIALYKDGPWATSLSVRGLGENRLVSMINGNRIETASDLAGSLSMIDVNEIDRVEVIKGSASSIYGTGAMGGIVNIITRTGEYQENRGIHGEVTGQYNGVNKLFGSHLALQSGGKKWYLRLSGGYRNADDIKTPSGVLENSQFSDYNYNGSFGVKPLKNHEFTVDFQNFMANDVGIPGGAPLAPSATATYKEAQRRMLSAKYSIKNPVDHLDEISLRYYNQYIYRDVELIPNMSPLLSGNKRITVGRITPAGAHTTNGLVFETSWSPRENNTLIAGIDVWQRSVLTTREKFITQEILNEFGELIKTMEIVKSEKPTPDSRFTSAGLYIQDDFSLIHDRLDIQLGARFDGIHVSNEQAFNPMSLSIDGELKDPVPGQRQTFAESQELDLSWSMNAGGLYHLDNQFDLAFNFGRSFRSPSLEERFKYIDLGSKVRLGDPLLEPEKGWFGDLGFRLWNEKITGKVNVFSNYLDNMIVEKPGVFIYNETDTLPALVNTNVDKAFLAGFEARFDYLMSNSLVFSGQASYVKGVDLLNNSNLPLIAPLSSSLCLRYHLAGFFSAQWTTTAVAAQNKVSEGESATEGYLKSDFSIFSTPRQLGQAGFQIFFGVDNVFNAEYTNHLSTNRGVIKTEAGRNVFVKLQLKF
ncbi:MAG: TonB-dependent receptor [Bacteroidales bacterium]|nr:TonB-dependent receptor [Bacteroidales bacterium]